MVGIGYRSAVLFLLPPSEGKTPAASGPVLRHTKLSFPELNATRRQVQQSLQDLCRSHPTKARRVLDLGPTQDVLISSNAELDRARCAPAVEVYTGVLYDALSASTLTKSARKRLNAMTAISSALFGLIRPDDLICAYRLSGTATLPDLGSLSRLWAPQVAAILDKQDGPIVDMRSQAYVNLGPIPQPAWERAMTMRILVEANGKRSVVSHHNKATKGRIVRLLASATALPKTVDGLLARLERGGYACELHESTKGPARLDVIVDHV